MFGCLFAIHALHSTCEDLFLCFRIDAGQRSPRNVIEATFVNDRRSKASAISTFPNCLRFRDVIFPAGLHRNRPAASTFDCIDHIAIHDNARTKLIAIIEVHAIPAKLAALWIEAPDFAGRANDQFGRRAHLGNSRRAPNIAKFFRIQFPQFFASVLIESDQCAPLRARRHDQNVLVNNRTGRRTPSATIRSRANTGLPKFFTVQIKGQYAALAKENEHALSIRSRRMGSVSMLRYSHAAKRIF